MAATTAVMPETIFRKGEFHAFDAGGRKFVYSVPGGGIFAPGPVALDALEVIGDGELSASQAVAGLMAKGHDAATARETLAELFQVRVLADQHGFYDPPQEPVENFPLQSIVLNLTNQCNLSCHYCYEFGADKVATPEGKPKFMDQEVARAAVDHLFDSARERRSVHVTFFGGETLMNFPLLQWVVSYAQSVAAERNQSVDFSLTTNGTLLTEEIIEFLAANEIGVTVSMDGPKEMHDQLRVYSNGKGSYDVMAPKVKALLRKHRTRPIAARVTLTDRVTDVKKIFRHLREEFGFAEVGFAPVTAGPERLYTIGNNNMDTILDQFKELAEEYLAAALQGRAHGFSNVSDTLAELHAGINKSHPCGAGLGLVGVGPSGDIAPCHRFVDSDAHAMGNVKTGGLDKAKQAEFLQKGHVNAKYECQTCFARPLCAGGCHHESLVRYGEIGHANTHFCDWIRDWTSLCLKIYGQIATHNPTFLTYFETRKALS